MNYRADGKYCLATVTTSSYLIGTAVLVHSFLEKNNWFDGDIVIITETKNLSPSEIDILRGFDRVMIVDIGEELRENIRALEEINPSFLGKSARFFSLEVFNLERYEKVLFCDSDLLFLDSIKHLFSDNQPLLCCGDGPYYQGLNRNKYSFKPCAPKAPEQELANTFNAGLMLIDQSLITRSNYQSLVDMTTAPHWTDSSITHTDQRIFNLFFAGQQKLVSPVYNYLLAHQNSIDAAHPDIIDDIKVFHFNGAAKPWQLMRSMSAIDDNVLQFQAAIRWYQQFERALSHRHLAMLNGKSIR
ncbi:glycosyltransferase family 8 protein [Sphingorhabdus sp. SMR4y]|uniref:glycosyltransferase family 8 protein n=1 Tax=Sphingorhabdus sp. SMR4y TaxID=2584094 RepID=UPI000B5C6C7B|nr:glycosyltransferase [Sphingorhabdus sp. SMR4y]ASK87112.1 glycosyl transferase family 8 [Sphingorhabdus sp. SMR4y]